MSTAPARGMGNRLALWVNPSGPTELLGRPGAPAIGQRTRVPWPRRRPGRPPWAAITCWGFPSGTEWRDLWDLMAELEADDALVWVEMVNENHWCPSALLWFPSERAAATALVDAYNGGAQPQIDGCRVWLSAYNWGD